MKRAIFLDRDGTIIREPSDYQIDSLEKLDFLPFVISSLRTLMQHGYRLVMVSNQDGLGQPHFPVEHFEVPQRKMEQILASEGVVFDAVFVDEHYPEDNHPNRKPGTGMVLPYVAKHQLDLGQCFMVGDRRTDAHFAQNLGVKSLTIKDALSNDGDKKYGDYPVFPTTRFTDWRDLLKHVLNEGQHARVERKTKETTITVELWLQGQGRSQIKTGLGFFDHMLEQLALHSGIDLHISTEGDLHIDEHHTIEDTALALGSAFRQALGNKAGLARYGFDLVMDEAQTRCALDFSGRPWLVYQASFQREKVGDFPTEMLGHFYKSFADAAGLTLHIEITGDNAHHQIESSFKALGRAIRQALAQQGSELPSTKGTL